VGLLNVNSNERLGELRRSVDDLDLALRRLKQAETAMELADALRSVDAYGRAVTLHAEQLVALAHAHREAKK